MPTATRKTAAPEPKPEPAPVVAAAKIVTGSGAVLEAPATPPTPMERLTRPFSSDQIEVLPKQLRKDDREKYQCRQGTQASADGTFCGGFHARSIHLSYVGHAGVTMRLNEVDPSWSWEPMALTPQGLPAWSDGGLWIRLTVLGVTRLGFGDAQGKTGPNATKEAYGDAIRNTAMRFGVATYLWSKSDAAKAIAERGDEIAAKAEAEAPAPVQRNGSVHADMSYQQEAPGGPNDQLRLTHIQAFWTDFNALTEDGQSEIKVNWPKGFPNPDDLTIEQVAAVRDLVKSYVHHLEMQAKVNMTVANQEAAQAGAGPAQTTIPVATTDGDEPPF